MPADGTANLKPFDPATARKPLPPHQKLDLMFDLAKGEMTHGELATKYDRHKTQIHEFAAREVNKLAIQRIKDAGMEKLAGLWAADKGARVAALQDSAEKLAELRTDAGKVDPAAERARQAALRNVAEELGQLTSKSQVEMNGLMKVTYELVGVDPADLQ